jgi:hypothetical protein
MAVSLCSHLLCQSQTNLRGFYRLDGKTASAVNSLNPPAGKKFRAIAAFLPD